MLQELNGRLQEFPLFCFFLFLEKHSWTLDPESASQWHTCDGKLPLDVHKQRVLRRNQQQLSVWDLQCEEVPFWLGIPFGWRTGCMMSTPPGEVTLDRSAWRSLPLCLFARQMDRVTSSVQYTNPWNPVRESFSSTQQKSGFACKKKAPYLIMKLFSCIQYIQEVFTLQFSKWCRPNILFRFKLQLLLNSLTQLWWNYKRGMIKHRWNVQAACLLSDSQWHK